MSTESSFRLRFWRTCTKKTDDDKLKRLKEGLTDKRCSQSLRGKDLKYAKQAISLIKGYEIPRLAYLPSSRSKSGGQLQVESLRKTKTDVTRARKLDIL